MRYLPDTSCLIALLCHWHERHAITLKEMNHRIRAGDTAVLSAHSLVESFAVLTRLPYPYRLSGRDAWELLDANFSKSELVSLTPRQYWGVLKTCRDSGISGGQIYDGVIAACARRAKAKILLTWNPDHFLPFGDQNLIVELPGGGSERAGK